MGLKPLGPFTYCAKHSTTELPSPPVISMATFPLKPYSVMCTKWLKQEINSLNCRVKNTIIYKIIIFHVVFSRDFRILITPYKNEDTSNSIPWSMIQLSSPNKVTLESNKKWSEWRNGLKKNKTNTSTLTIWDRKSGGLNIRALSVVTKWFNSENTAFLIPFKTSEHKWLC